MSRSAFVPSPFALNTYSYTLSHSAPDCLRHLAAYRMAHPQVIAGVGALAADRDEWVRLEAEQALAQLKAGQ